MAIASNRNWADAFAGLGWSKFWTGSIDETIPLHERAIHLSPRDPNIGHWLFRIGHVHLLQSRTDEAIIWLEKARRVAPALPFIHFSLASACGLKGETERAAAALTEANRRGWAGWIRLPGMGHAPTQPQSLSSIADLRANTILWPQKVRLLSEATFFVGLRKAGLAEE